MFDFETWVNNPEHLKLPALIEYTSRNDPQLENLKHRKRERRHKRSKYKTSFLCLPSVKVEEHD